MVMLVTDGVGVGVGVGCGVGVGVVTGAALDTVAGGVGTAEAEPFLLAFRLTVMSTMTAATTAMSKIPPKSICHFVLTAACSAAGVLHFRWTCAAGCAPRICCGPCRNMDSGCADRNTPVRSAGR